MKGDQSGTAVGGLAVYNAEGGTWRQLHYISLQTYWRALVRLNRASAFALTIGKKHIAGFGKGGEVA